MRTSMRTTRHPTRMLATAALLLATAAGALACADLFHRPDHQPGDVAWRVPYADSGWWWQGRPAVVGNRVFFQAAGVILALDGRDGALLWRSAPVTLDPRYDPRNIVADDGRVFAAGGLGVFSLDAATGATRWVAFPGNRQFTSTFLALDGGQLYVGDKLHHVYALDAADGHVRWSTDVGPDWPDVGVAGGFAVQGDTVYVAETKSLNQYATKLNAIVIALDRRDGRELWRLTLDGDGRRFYGAPVVAGRLVLAADYYVGGVFAVDRFTGALVWHFDTDPGWIGIAVAPLVIGDEVYAGAGDGDVYAADLATGRVKWKASAGGSISELGVCGRYLWATVPGAALVDRHTGQVRRRVATADDRLLASGYAAAGGRIFAAGHDSMYAFWC